MCEPNTASTAHVFEINTFDMIQTYFFEFDL